MSPLNLDDAATLLMQLEATDTADLAALRDALTDLAFENRVPLAAQPHVARAARVLGTVVNGTAADVSAAFAEAGQAIEAAMKARDHQSGAVGDDGADPVAPARSATVEGATGIAGASGATASFDLTSAADRATERPATRASSAAPAHQRPKPTTVPATPAAPAAPPVAVRDFTEDRLPDDADRDLLPDFITESNECVTNSEAALLQLEANPSDEEAVNTVFRAFHTVKGTSAFLGLTRIAAFAHEAESLLSRVRDKEIAYSQGCADLSLRSADMLKALLSVVEQSLNGDGRMPIPEGYFELLDALLAYDPARDANGVQLAVGSGSDDIFPTAPAAGDESAIRGPMAGGVAKRADNAGGQNANAAGSSNADATIRVRTDRLDRQLARIAKPSTEAKRAALKAGAEIVADEMRRLAPVRSGALRDSINVRVIGMGAAAKQVDVRGTTVLIGPRQGGKKDPFYAHMIEFGTVRAAAHPFMRPAWDAKRDDAE
ncbi:MAG: HK97-gp10 family putative phage morphogenesis protein, partial [Gemmatimonas sp.]